MFSPDETEQTTGALERLPRTLDYRNGLTERRQNILQQKQTDALPVLVSESPNAKVARRQVSQLREENRHLRYKLSERQAELEQLHSQYRNMATRFEKEVVAIHSGQQQELAYYQSHLQMTLEERNRIQGYYTELEQRYQELASSIEARIEDEARHLMQEAALTVIEEPEKAPALLQDIAKTIALQLRQEEDLRLAETLYLKRVLQKMVEQLEVEQQKVEVERQQLFSWQYRLHEQAIVRQKLLHDRLYIRWRLTSLLTSLGLMIALIVLQFVALVLFHMRVSVPLSLSIVAPIVVCALLMFVFENGPLSTLRYILQNSGARKKKNK